MAIIKNIAAEQVFAVKDLVDYVEEATANLTLAKNDQLNLSVFAFDVGEGLSTHQAPGDAFITILDGEAEIVIADEKYQLKTGESIIMPLGKPHSVLAVTKMKMLLNLVKA